MQEGFSSNTVTRRPSQKYLDTDNMETKKSKSMSRAHFTQIQWNTRTRRSLLTNN